MTLSRVLGGVGRTFIGLGLILLLFVAYQLWGTGIQEARAQGALENEFDDLLDTAQTPEHSADAQTAGAETGGDTAPATDPDVRTYQLSASEAPDDLEFSEAEIDLVWRPQGDASFRLSIPRINVSKVVVAGVATEDLRKGPGHYPSTPLPGQPGNAAVAGHRTTYGAPFNRIDELRPGDEIYVETVQGTFTYRVIEQSDGLGHFIVSPDRVEVLSQNNLEHPNRLTLTACHPKYSAAQRIIVVAELVGDPVVAVPRPGSAAPAAAELASEDLDGAGSDATGDDGTAGGATAGDDGTAGDEAGDEAGGAGTTTTGHATEGDRSAGDAGAGNGFGDDEMAAAALTTDSFGEGLDGDAAAVLPAVVWGLAAAMIWFTAWFVGRRWRRWPSYLLGFAPFMVVLFVCFVHADQALPSY